MSSGWRRRRRSPSDLGAVPAPSHQQARDAALRSFVSLYSPADEGEVPEAEVREAIVEQFHRLYYNDSEATWRNTFYRGVPIAKCPLDLWVYQEIICEVRPELIIETGTFRGGSAYWMGDLCETLGAGQVVTIDIEEQQDRPQHDRVTYLHGSSIGGEVLSAVRERLPAGAVLVILDSDHSCEHVLAELHAYGPVVTPGSYLIVEDTNAGGHPVVPGFGAGPMEAVQQFLAQHPEFSVDRSREKFMMTFNPSGYLRRSGMAKSR